MSRSGRAGGRTMVGLAATNFRKPNVRSGILPASRYHVRSGKKTIMLKIQLLAFGIAKDIIGARSASIELPATASLKDLRTELLGRFPAFSQLRSLAFAVNTDYRSDDYLLRDGDEVVLIPPVSGG